jgi:hypothetical protein
MSILIFLSFSKATFHLEAQIASLSRVKDEDWKQDTSPGKWQIALLPVTYCYKISLRARRKDIGKKGRKKTDL